MALENGDGLYRFIGGPWNNRLVDLGRSDAREWRVPYLPEYVQWDLGDSRAISIPNKDETYLIDDPLATGVKVMSCLFRHSAMLGRVPVQ